MWRFKSKTSACPIPAQSRSSQRGILVSSGTEAADISLGSASKALTTSWEHQISFPKNS